ncbi:MAG TPA: hypothetical protein VFQ44_29380 [Streptosporangiaceae bacterium]|nr:hypothetical protein [Streptosporangiaceae bacterium]
MFISRPLTGQDRPPAPAGLRLVRAVRGSFTGQAEFLDDAENRARVSEYLADMVRPYGLQARQDLTGQSYGEMAQSLIGSAVAADEPVDLLILAFAIHDLRPGRQTASYLAHVTPGAPMAFAICDQGSAATFSGLRIATAYASSAGITRALVTVVEQAGLPYKSTARLPAEHRAVALLFDTGASDISEPAQARVTGIRQHPGVAPDAAGDLAAASLAALTGGRHDVELVLSAALAQAWPGHRQARVMPPGQPSTDIWWGLVDELASDAGRPGLLVLADYDPDLRYLCLTALARPGTRASGRE